MAVMSLPAAFRSSGRQHPSRENAVVLGAVLNRLKSRVRGCLKCGMCRDNDGVRLQDNNNVSNAVHMVDV